jgi:hypothetical protein
LTNVIKFPDADAYSDWWESARQSQRNGIDVKVSSIIESLATELEKQNGCDLADYLIEEIKQRGLRKDFIKL